MNKADLISIEEEDFDEMNIDNFVSFIKLFCKVYNLNKKEIDKFIIDVKKKNLHEADIVLPKFLFDRVSPELEKEVLREKDIRDIKKILTQDIFLIYFKGLSKCLKYGFLEINNTWDYDDALMLTFEDNNFSISIKEIVAHKIETNIKEMPDELRDFFMLGELK